MDMNKILQNFETAANGEYKPSKQESSDMKMILESFNEVAADDATPQQLDEIASVSVSGETADEVAQLVRLMNDAGAPEAAPVGAQPTTMHEPSPCGGPPDMPPKDTMITPKMMDDFDTEEEPVAEDDWDNAPEETYDDHETMTLDLSGGINRRKNSYKRAEPGDNPMAVESSLKEELSKMLKKKMSESNRDEDDDYQDYLEYRAEARATGQEVMSYDEWSGKTSARSRADDRYNRALQYYDLDDPAIDDFMETSQHKMSEEENDDYQDYLEYRAEARATGQEVMSYDEWSGKTSARGRAEDRYNRALQYYDLDDPAIDDFMEGTMKTKSNSTKKHGKSKRKIKESTSEMHKKLPQGETVEFNTGRYYAPEGQIIEATWIDTKSNGNIAVVAFNDKTRRIMGIVEVPVVGNVISATDVMDRYDAGGYEMPTRSEYSSLIASARSPSEVKNTFNENTNMKLVKKAESGNRAVKIYKDTEWDEFVLKHYENGEYLENADYFDDDKQSVIDSAKYFLSDTDKTESTYTLEARKDSNFNLSDIEKLSNMDLETAKQHASEMMQNASNMKPLKVQHFLRQIENAPSVAEIIFIMWNQYLAGTGDAVIGSRHSTKKSNYRQHFEDTDIEESPLDYKSFKEGDDLQQLRDAIENNKIVSVAFVKKDGSVKQMAIKKNLSAYVASTAPKTDRQANVQQNNDIYKVVDINAYNKRLRDLKQEGLDPEQARAEAAKRAWRSIKLPNVLGFSVGGQFIDLRDENDIMDRFGEEVYNSLSRTMQKSMNDNQQASESMFAEATQNTRNFVAKHAQRSGAGAHVSKKDKTGRKSKHKAKEIQYESAPVFKRYVKPFLNLPPSKIVEFYDSQARPIIKRLAEERTSLQKANLDTRAHDAVLAQLRENLSVLDIRTHSTLQKSKKK